MTHFQWVATEKADSDLSMPFPNITGADIGSMLHANKLILYDSFGRDVTTFFPEMLNALENGLCADHNTNICQLVPSDLSKQILQISVCASYCIVTAQFLYNLSLDSFPHYMTKEDVILFVLSK